MDIALKLAVLGTGCSKCRSTVGVLERTARECGIDLDIAKVEKPEDIQAFGVHATPAVAIGDQVIHSGGIPSRERVHAWFRLEAIGLLRHPTRYLFFAGKGGVGKTSLSAATAVALADAGRKVLLVSTDAASNLDEMLDIALANSAVPVPGAPGLSVLNIDPERAAEAYRRRVLGQMESGATAEELSTVREQLSGLHDRDRLLRRVRFPPG